MNINKNSSEIKRLKAVLKIGQAVSKSLDVNRIFKMTCEMTTKIIKADRCSIALQSTENSFEIVQSYLKKSSYPLLVGVKFILREYPIIAKTLLKGKTVHIFGLKKNQLSTKEKKIFKQMMTKVLLTVPIIVDRKIIGAVILSRVEKSEPFSSLDLSLCKTITNQVGIVIKNAKLIKILKEKHKELETSKQQAHLISERLRYLIFSTSAVIYAAKTSGDYGATFITENVKKMVGYSPHKFIKNSSFWIDHVHPEDVKRILQELSIVFKQGYHIYEYRFRCKNGKYIWMRDEMKLMRDERGQPIEIIGYWVDVTDRRKVEIAMIESENRYRRLFEDSPISLWEEDFSSIKNYLDKLKYSGIKNFREFFESHPEEIAKCAAMIKVVAVNKTTLTWYKAKSIKELRSGLNKIFRKESYEVFKEGLIAIAEGKTIFESDAINQTLRGEKIDINIRWSVVTGYERSLSRLLVSIIDVTERKLAQKQLAELANRVIQAQEEERKNIASKLHDVISQDLAAIRMDLRMVQQDPTKNINQVKGKLEEDEKLLSATLENISNLTSDLRPRILDDLGLFSAIRWYVDKFRRRTNLDFHLKIAGSHKRLSPQTKTTIFRIIQEGLTNIAKHSKTRSVSLSLSSKAKYISIVIQDNGIGFDPKRLYSPTRFGLLRMKENTHLVGGKFNIISKKGKGTKLHITFPYTDK